MKIFATSYGGSHVKTIKPVIKELAKRGHACIYMPQTIVNKDEFDDVSVVSCQDFIDSDNEKIKQYGEILAQKHHSDHVMQYHESVSYLGQLFYDNYLAYGEEKSWEIYHKHGLAGFNPVAYMKKVLMHFSPDFVIATNAPRMERAALHVATMLNIKNLCIVDFQGLREIEWLKDVRYCSALAVNSSAVCKKLIDAGRSPSSIYITGSPLFEKISLMSQEQIKNYNKDFAFVENRKPIIFFAEQQVSVYRDLSISIKHKLYEACQKYGWILKIRRHPNTISEVGEHIPEGVIISCGKTAVEDDVLSCDVCVTITSTVGWMALVAGKPLLVVPHSSESKNYDVGERDGAFVMNSIDEIEGCLLKIINGTGGSKTFINKSEFIERHPFASKNIASLIENFSWGVA
jgi:predicted glycosyltransferase